MERVVSELKAISAELERMSVHTAKGTPRSHPDIEYQTDPELGTFETFDDAMEALTKALTPKALSSGEAKGALDVLVYSEAGAEFFGGDDAVEQYKEDPEASIFEHVEVTLKMNPTGRVP